MSIRAKHQHGLSLVELMVAMAVAMVLLVGIGQIFISSRASYQINDGLSRLQENGRFAIDFLSFDLRMAGQAGCTVDQVNNLLNGGAGIPFNLNQPVFGFEYQGTGPGNTINIASLDPTTATANSWNDDAGNGLPGDLAAAVVPQTDVVYVRGAHTISGVYPAGNTPANAATIGTTQATGVPQGAIVMVSDCQAADVFQKSDNASASSMSRGTGCGGATPCNVNPATNDFTRAWDTSAQLFTVSTKAYYVGASDRDNDGNPDPPATALFEVDYSTGSPVRRELVEGVENMQVLYGVDSVPDATRRVDQYVTADNVPDWRDVVSVRVALLMRTNDQLPGQNDTATYVMTASDDTNGTRIVADPQNDRRLRKVFATTVAVRNTLARK